MELRYDTISFLSDYGTVDEFVGVVHSVVRSISPEVRVIDITHQVPPHDVRAGALTLARAAQYLAPGVVVAVVDPGVGTDRRAIAVEVGDGDSVLVGPDNGLLAPAVAMVGGATRAFALDNPAYHLPAPGATFDGRDVFAPVAAHLCTGVPIDEVGTEVDPNGLRPTMIPVTQLDGDVLSAEALWIDQFGNVQLNVDPDEIAEFGDVVALDIGGRRRSASRVDSYAELRTGEVGLLIDSYGLLAVVANQASAADELSVTSGDEVALSPLDGEPRRDPDAGLHQAVTLRTKDRS
ncbi:MAG: SAM-dependent chlorinase/fluorinase [Acidimicrobiales bacterium]|nr:SAM-dependent chlorinase/fluorinase [Acidimicrobiales bacterium]